MCARSFIVVLLRERERQRQRHRQTDRQTDREREREDQITELLKTECALIRQQWFGYLRSFVQCCFTAIEAVACYESKK